MSAHDAEEKLDSTVAMPVDSEDAAPEGEQPAGEDPLTLAEKKAEENWDKYLRSVAELDNVRKRARRDVENAHKFAIERFANDLLAVSDSLSMGLDAAPDADTAKLREGTEATLKLLLQVYERYGVAELDPLGEPFNPEFHEAMTMQQAPDAEPGSVLVVVQRGYTLNGRLLRPARVVVAAEPAESA